MSEVGSSIYQHPKFKEIEKYELGNREQLIAARLVYLDLCEAKQWWNLDLHTCCDLGLVFISGHATRHTPRELVLPLPRGCTITPSDLQTYLHTLTLENYQTGITMAVMDTDSTTVYYKISDGLVPPPCPEMTEKKKLYHTERINKRRIDVIASVNKYIEKKLRCDSSNEVESSKTELLKETQGT